MGVENKNIPPEGTITQRETIQIVYRIKNGKEVGEVTVVDEHAYIKDERGLWLERYQKTHQSYEVSRDENSESQKLFTDLIINKKEKK